MEASIERKLEEDEEERAIEKGPRG